MFAGARREGYALGSFNVVSLEMAYGAIDAAEKLESPVIIAVTDGHHDYYQLETLAAGLVEMAEAASVPVGLHFDHAVTLAAVARALRAGFTSVMYDGEGQSWNTLLQETRVVTQMAHGVGALVEGALSAQSREMTANPTGDWELPPHEMVEEFLNATHVDILAIGEGSSDLDPEQVSAIATTAPAFVSLHGGSQLDDATVAVMIESGLLKCSVYGKVAAEALRVSRECLEDESANVLELGSAIRDGFAAGIGRELTRFLSVNHA